MKEIRIQINASGDGIETPEDFFHFIPEILKMFKFVQDQHNPDFALIFSKQDPPIGNYVKILYAREYLNANMRKWDWGLGWQYPEMVANQHRYIRFPNYTFNGAGTNLIKGPNYDPKKILEQKTKFCAFVYYHNVPERNDFFKYMNTYYNKRIECPGVCCNNVPALGGHATPKDSRLSKNFYSEKIEYLKQFKFTIAFENRSAIGYTSEKIYNAMQANSIPIYWGNPLVHRDFNPKSFINSYDYKYKNMKDLYGWLIDRIAELDRNDDKYLQILKQPWYHGNVCSEYTDRKKILDFFCRLFNSK